MGASSLPLLVGPGQLSCLNNTCGGSKVSWVCCWTVREWVVCVYKGLRLAKWVFSASLLAKARMTTLMMMERSNVVCL